jgi:Fe-S-cluster containining protein
VIQSGLKLHLVQGNQQFHQPCSASREGQCTIYESRPGACREYGCALLVKHEAGEVTSASAHSIITSAKLLRDKLRPQLEKLAGVSEPRSIRALYRLSKSQLDSATQGPNERRQNAELLLDMAALRALLTKHFRFSRTDASEDIEEASMNSP